MRDLAINLLASLIAGVAVVAFQRLVRLRRLARKRAFFGIRPGSRCTLSVSRHAASKLSDSVHRRDLAATVELATLVKECGGETDVIVGTGDQRGVGELPEFCIGGPHGNQRTAAHLKRFVPGFRINTFEEDPEGLTMFVGEKKFQRIRGQVEFVLLIRVTLSDRAAAPLWIICGQIAQTNYATARYLASEYQSLMKTFGTRKRFCIALQLLDSRTYGHSQLEVVGDLTDLAFGEAAENSS